MNMEYLRHFIEKESITLVNNFIIFVKLKLKYIQTYDLMEELPSKMQLYPHKYEIIIKLKGWNT